MFKLIRLLFLMCSLFTGLYFFGDFRVNDVNVRDFLREHVTWQRIQSVKAAVVQIYQTVSGLAGSLSESKQGGSTAVAPGSPQDILKQMGATDLNVDQIMKGLPLDKISAQDQNKLKELINKTINESAKTKNK